MSVRVNRPKRATVGARICLCGRVSLCRMRQKYMFASKRKVRWSRGPGGGQNTCCAFKHSLIQGNLTKAFGKHNTKQNTSDKEIQTLPKNLPFVIESGLAVTTNKRYFRGWKNWVDWSNIKQGVISCFADPFHAAKYLNHVLFISGTKGSTITALY